MLSERDERWLPYEDATLFDLAADFEQYPCYMPGWQAASISLRDGERLQAEHTIGVGPVRLRFRTAAALRRPHCIELTSDDRQFRTFNLKWTFIAGGGCNCRVGLSVDVALRSIILQRAVESFGPGSAKVLLEAFAQRTEAIVGTAAARRVT